MNQLPSQDSGCGKAPAHGADFLTDARDGGGVIGLGDDLIIHTAIWRICVSPIPRDVTAGVPSRIPLGLNGLRGS